MNETSDEDRRRGNPFADGGTKAVGVSGNVTTDVDQSAEDVPDTDAVESPSQARRELLLEAVRRAPILRVLKDRSADAAELAESIDMSRSTVHRATNALQAHDVLEKSNGEYELTGLGEVIAEKTETFGREAWTAMALRQFLNSIDMNGNGIPVEHFLNATIIQQEPRQPHANIHRIIKLIEQSDSLRMLSTVISPVYVDVGYREMMDGMQIEAVFESAVVDIMASEFTGKLRETVSTGSFDVYAHDDIPFELFLFDDKVGMAAHSESGTAEVLVECDDPAAVAWAENIYDGYLTEAERLRMPE